MKQGSNNRRSRSRGGGKRNTGGGGGGGGKNNFESNGPEVKIRGTAQQVQEKYLALARDASSAGDRISAEAFFQHAEHYHRIINPDGGNGAARGRGGRDGRQPSQPGAPEPAEPVQPAEVINTSAAALAAVTQPEGEAAEPAAAEDGPADPEPGQAAS